MSEELKEAREFADLLQADCIHWFDKFFDHDVAAAMILSRDKLIYGELYR